STDGSSFLACRTLKQRRYGTTPTRRWGRVYRLDHAIIWSLGWVVKRVSSSGLVMRRKARELRMLCVGHIAEWHLQVCNLRGDGRIGVRGRRGNDGVPGRGGRSGAGGRGGGRSGRAARPHGRHPRRRGGGRGGGGAAAGRSTPHTGGHSHDS